MFLLWTIIDFVLNLKYLHNRIFDRALSPVVNNTENEQESSSGSNITLPVPPGMSEYSFKRITHENPLRPEELEQVSNIVTLIIFSNSNPKRSSGLLEVYVIFCSSTKIVINRYWKMSNSFKWVMIFFSEFSEWILFDFKIIYLL